MSIFALLSPMDVKKVHDVCSEFIDRLDQGDDALFY